MKNPLFKRVFRELLGDWKKYLALFLLLTITIGMVSGMFVANDSMETAALEAYETYNIEDGHFTLKEQADDALLSAFAAEGITIVPQFYRDFDEDADGDGLRDATVRVFRMREEMNRACLMDGSFPAGENEILIDRMHADNVGVSVGDEITLSGTAMKVSGLAAFSDYSTLYENPSDTMFNALTFNIAAVTPAGWERLKGKTVWQYAFQYEERPAGDNEQKEKSDILVEQLAVLAATGGMLDDADEAETLENNVEAWTDYLEEKQAQADDLEARGEALQAESDAFQEKLAGLSLEEQMAQAAELQEEGERLQAQAEQLQEEADTLAAEADRIQETADKLKALEPYEDHRNELTQFVPEYANPAIHFAPDDMGSDKAMGEVLLILLVAVLAFIFAITQSNTIQSEAAVIGTLRASGYTRGELLRHYLAAPVLVTLLAALAGNVLGYTVFKDVVVSMYYNSYSLPTYVTLWNADGFLKTTLYPVPLMLLINLLVIARKLRLTPLQFLRGELGGARRKRAVRLPNWGFLRRFRLRILFQNIAGYLTLLLGILFVMVLLCFSVGMPATLASFQEEAPKYLLADYQVVLKDTEDADGNPITTAEPTAERYSVSSLKTVDGVRVGEEISVYGYTGGSAYLPLPDDLPDDRATVSQAYADKFGLEAGQRITLREPYADKTHSFTVAGIYDLPGYLAIFLPNDSFNRCFDRDEGSYTGYLSRNEITDIDPEWIVSVLTVEDTLKISRQPDHSMGAYMTYFSWACVLIAMLLLFLLTKQIIERNSVSISMVKVLGYNNREISAIFIRLTTVVVILSAVATAFLSIVLVDLLWRQIMYDMNGWLAFTIGPWDIVRIILMVILAYLAVALLDLRRIRRIPMTEALKSVE